jgi:hypothetical protein
MDYSCHRSWRLMAGMLDREESGDFLSEIWWLMTSIELRKFSDVPLPLPLNLNLRVRRIEIHTYEERNESE